MQRTGRNVLMVHGDAVGSHDIQVPLGGVPRRPSGVAPRRVLRERAYLPMIRRDTARAGVRTKVVGARPSGTSDCMNAAEAAHRIGSDGSDGGVVDAFAN